MRSKGTETSSKKRHEFCSPSELEMRYAIGIECIYRPPVSRFGVFSSKSRSPREQAFLFCLKLSTQMLSATRVVLANLVLPCANRICWRTSRSTIWCSRAWLYSTLGLRKGVVSRKNSGTFFLLLFPLPARLDGRQSFTPCVAVASRHTVLHRSSHGLYYPKHPFFSQ